MYLFLDLTICGVALAAHSWYVLLILVILLPLQMRNSRRERHLLHEKFGEQFEVYRRARLNGSERVMCALSESKPEKH
jgi:protein-S-isoprenylcysteine O-methyltransferase Ste14